MQDQIEGPKKGIIDRAIEVAEDAAVGMGFIKRVYDGARALFAGKPAAEFAEDIDRRSGAAKEAARGAREK